MHMIWLGSLLHLASYVLVMESGFAEVDALVAIHQPTGLLMYFSRKPFANYL